MKKLIVFIATGCMALCVAVCAVLGLGSVSLASADEAGSTMNVHDVVAYGKYNGRVLKWEVVAKSGTRATLFLKDVLRDGTANADGNTLLKQFNLKDQGAGSEGQKEWLSSPLRTFLNDDFYNAAFSSEQKDAVIGVTSTYPGCVVADSTRQGETVENPAAGSSANPSKVFLPSYGDIAAWYERLEDRALGDTSVWWWTRSPVYVVPGTVSASNGGERQLVWYVHEGGENRAPVSYYLALRPVIVVDTAKFVPDVVTVNVSGTVNAGAKVVLYRGNEKIAETTADANGAYSFASVEEGDYVLEVSLDGYVTQRVNVTVGSADVVKDVTLSATGGGDTPNPPTPGTPSVPNAPEKKGLSGGVIAVIVIVCVAVIAGGGVGVFFLLKKKAGK